MTRARMIELKDALEDAGWEVSTENSKGDLFYVEDEAVEWILLNENKEKKRLLRFCLFDHLGRRTTNLSDILYVEEVSLGIELYFKKINTKEWKATMKDFVSALS
ncbi:hypothetical protein H8I69_07740 [Serratia fonticola]|uniref:hypothetical protein n=1 Tax=Serratia fonticola TaxID=47917 RepID=UPI0015C60F03|nr:hypothetical protein [Serratia fonticola]MBC3379008.1 hypothetical protein [Serratia fonticola]NYA38208.1 hypothetical protein [Serratia fonticola]